MIRSSRGHGLRKSHDGASSRPLSVASREGAAGRNHVSQERKKRPDFNKMKHKVFGPYDTKTDDVLKDFFAKVAEEGGYQRRPYTNVTSARPL